MSADTIAPPAPTAMSYVMVATLVLVWGTTFLFVAIALREAPPMVVAGTRIGLGAAVVLPYAFLTGHGLPRDAAGWRASLVVGSFGVGFPVILLCWAQQVVPSGIAGVYMAAIPLFILPLAHVFSNGERMTPRKVTGFVVGFCGVLLLIGPETLMQLGSADARAQLACLGAALCYATGSILIRRSGRVDPIALAAGALLCASVFAVPLAIAAWPAEALSVETWAVLLWVGAAATGLGMVLRVKVISTAGSVFLSVAGYFMPIVALIAGWAVLDETIEPMDALACALILGGVFYAQRRMR